MFYTRLVCGLCSTGHDSSVLQSLCKKCGRPLLAQYDLESVSKYVSKAELKMRQPSLWRYRELLPLPLDLSTLKEPFRLEGKKTLGYELAEQLDWQLPDVILYPTGGGTGLIGMCKAFDEMQQLGWINTKRPRMVCVQASGYCPLVSAFESGAQFATEYKHVSTKAFGLRVPKALGDFLILQAIRRSHGTAIAVPDEEMMESATEIGTAEGVFSSPEGAACHSALKNLLNSGWIKTDETIVLFNTGSGLKYLDSL